MTSCLVPIHARQLGEQDAYVILHCTPACHVPHACGCLQDGKLQLTRARSRRKLLLTTDIGNLAFSSTAEQLAPGSSIAGPGTPVDDGLWHFVRVSWLPSLQQVVLQLNGWDSSSQLGFLSGEHRTATLPDVTSSTAPAFFGDTVIIGSSGLRGAVDEVRVWAGEHQVAVSPAAAQAGSEPGLAFYLRFESVPLTAESLANHATGAAAAAASGMAAAASGTAAAAWSTRPGSLVVDLHGEASATLALHRTAQPDAPSASIVLTRLPEHGAVAVNGEHVPAVPFQFHSNATVQYLPSSTCRSLQLDDQLSFGLGGESSSEQASVLLHLHPAGASCNDSSSVDAWTSSVSFVEGEQVRVELPAVGAATCILTALPAAGTLFSLASYGGGDEVHAALHAVRAELHGCVAVFNTLSVDDVPVALTAVSFSFQACSSPLDSLGRCLGATADGAVLLHPADDQHLEPPVLLNAPMADRLAGDGAVVVESATPLEHECTVTLMLLLHEVPPRAVSVFSWGSAISLSLVNGQPELQIGDRELVVRSPASASLAAGHWVELSCSWDSLAARIFVDGAQVAVAALPGIELRPATTLSVFGSLHGLISELQVWPHSTETTPAFLVTDFADDSRNGSSQGRFSPPRPDITVFRGSTMLAGAPTADRALTSASTPVTIQLSVTATGGSAATATVITTLPHWGSLALPDGTPIAATPAWLPESAVTFIPGSLIHECDICVTTATFKYGAMLEGSDRIRAVRDFTVLVHPERSPGQVLKLSSQALSVRQNQMVALSIKVVALPDVPDVVFTQLPANGHLRHRFDGCGTQANLLSTRSAGKCAHYQFWPNLNFHGGEAIMVRADDGFEASPVAAIGVDVLADHSVLVSSVQALRELLLQVLGTLVQRSQFSVELWALVAGTMTHFAVSHSSTTGTVSFVDGRQLQNLASSEFASGLVAALRTDETGPLGEASVDEILGWTTTLAAADVQAHRLMSWDSTTPPVPPLAVLEQFYSGSPHLSTASRSEITFAPTAGIGGAALDMTASEVILPCTAPITGAFTVGLHLQLTRRVLSATVALEQPGLFTLGWDDEARLSFTVSALGVINNARAPESIADGAWHFVLAGYDIDGTTELFVDGMLVARGWSSAVEMSRECRDLLVHAFPGHLGAVALHSDAVYRRWLPRDVLTALLRYDELATEQLWLLTEGTGASLQRTGARGRTLNGIGLVEGAAWVTPVLPDAAPVYVTPGGHVCLPLFVSEASAAAEVVVTTVPAAGYMFEADEGCAAWTQRVQAGHVTAARFVVYAAPMHPETAAVGTLTYMASDDKGHSLPVRIELRVDLHQPSCRCATQCVLWLAGRHHLSTTDWWNAMQ